MPSVSAKDPDEGEEVRMNPTAVMLLDGERSTLDAAEEMGRSRSDLIREAVQRAWLKGKRKMTLTLAQNTKTRLRVRAVGESGEALSEGQI